MSSPAAAGASAAGGAVPPPSRAALLSEFCLLTGLAEGSGAELAQSFLEGHGWGLEPAVNAYLEMKAESVEGDAGGAGAGAGGEEEVRAPLPQKQERLFDESAEEQARRAYLHALLLQGRAPPEFAFEDSAAAAAAGGGRGSRRGRNGGAPPAATAAGVQPGLRAARPVSLVDPFRNFAAEASWKPAAAAAASSSSHGVSRRGGAGVTGAGARASGPAANLSKLFAPPEALLLTDAQGVPASMDQAIEEALRQRKWLLVNVQQGDEFSSHQLNRDVWRSPPIAKIIQARFIFTQLNHATADGARYRSLYRPPAIPTIAIIDPETRQKLWDCHAEAASDVDHTASTPMAEAAAKGEIVVGKPFTRRLLRTLTEWGEKTDLQMDGHAAPTPALSAAAAEEERLMQAAINASLAGSPTASPSKPARDAAAVASFSDAASSSSAAARPASVTAAPSSRSRAAGATSSRPPSSARAAAIVVDDDDDDPVDAASAATSRDEEYVPIDSDDGMDVTASDGEMEVRSVRGGKKREASDEDVAIIRTGSQARASRAATRPPTDGQAAGDKRKRQIQLDEEENKSANKIGRTSSSAAAAASSGSVSPSTDTSPLVAAASPALAPPPPPPAPISVPDEPAAGTPSVCRLQVRLPAGGKPVQRRFLKTDPIKLVLAFARSLMPPESQQQKLQLVTTHPRRELTDEEMSIEAHGVVNSSVIVEVCE